MEKQIQFSKKIISFVEEMRKYLPVIQRLKTWMWSLLHPYIKLSALYYTIVFLATLFSMLSPKFSGGVIDIITRSKDEDSLKDHALKMFIFTLVQAELDSIQSKLTNKLWNQVAQGVKCDLYKKLLECDLEVFDKASGTDINDVLERGISQVINLCFEGSLQIIQQTFKILGSLYFMYAISPKLTFIALTAIPLKYFLTFHGSQKKKNISEEFYAVENELCDRPSEVFGNISLVKCFSTERKESKSFTLLIKKFDELESMVRGSSWHKSFLRRVVNQGVDIILILVGGQMAFQGILTPGDISTFTLYSRSLTDPFIQLKYTLRGIQRSFKQAVKLMDFLEKSLKSKINNPDAPRIKKENLKGTISVQHVSFCYPAKPEVEVLSNVNLEITAGEATAFVGLSGSGKTTLSYLLQNLYTPTQGKIFIDGEDIRDYDIEWLHSHMGYVSQEPVLLNRTIEENLAYGLEEEYSQDRIDVALKTSNSHFILNKEKFPDGIKGRLGTGEGRIKLSGGQKQRIAIGRAFAKDPKILILDEPTSALDGESESKVQKAIDDLTGLGDRTVIVIAHRLSTIINCQKIVVFEDGKIVEQGTHRELIDKDGAYKKLFEFQLNSLQGL